MNWILACDSGDSLNHAACVNLCLAHFPLSTCIFVCLHITECALACVSISARVSLMLLLLPRIKDKQSGRIMTLPPSLLLSLTLPLCLSPCDDSAVCWSVLLLVSRHIVYPLTRLCVHTPPAASHSTPTSSSLLLIFLSSQSSHPLRADMSWVKLSALPQRTFTREQSKWETGKGVERWKQWVCL